MSLAGALQAENYVAIATIVLSTALNAAYFLPIIYLAWFASEDTTLANEHGEAPFAAVLALTVTAALTLAFFFFNGPLLMLETQIVQATP